MMSYTLAELDDLDQALHDAHLEVGSLRRWEGDLIELAGTVERFVPGEGFRVVGRFPVVVRIHGVDDVSAEDDYGVGVWCIEAIGFDPDTSELLFESAVPGRLRVRTSFPSVDVDVAEEPTAIRRWFRWRAV